MALLAAVLVLAATLPSPRTLLSKRSRLRADRPLALPTPLLTRVSRRCIAVLSPSRATDTIPQALEMLARALRGGASLLTALEAVAAELPAARFDQVARRVRGGLSLAESLDDWVDADAESRMTAALLVLGHSSGAAMAASLDRAAASLRRRRAVSDEIRALTSQTRASGLVVAAAPVGFVLIMAVVDRESLSSLFLTPVGLASLAVGLALEALGVWWMARLSAGVARWA